ncbi:hypothetical protein QYE76_013211 [Lolium multiflorum]|uniref:Uncharacterized protein n=1 Tax=Lolium multiflorum TaxID=4521 RepID=A0AAD8X7E6_LOLMU|nr:hypothetical protein QYE76_013211 [Lolium multiflorum]
MMRLENIAYDPVPVNDSFPNEQLAVIKVSSRESPWSWDSPPDMIMSRVEHNSELIRNLTYEIEDLKELVKKLVEKNPSPSSPKE